ncbi:uL15 family ribosomal protein [Candidatus Parcubacteria bacterium]|nr:uL15 family ribosomal protein [Candidatus Parcubacteria bacterium]
MQFHTLTRKTPNKKKKLVGRGGTRGKTSGRGTKGQNARAGHKKRPELRDFIKRVPKLRGRGKAGLRSFQTPLKGEALKAHLSSKKLQAKS